MGYRGSGGKRGLLISAWAGPVALAMLVALVAVAMLLTGCDQGSPATSATTATPAATAPASPTAPAAAMPTNGATAGTAGTAAPTGAALEAQMQLPADSATATAPPPTASATPTLTPTGTPTVAAPTATITPTGTPTATPAAASGIIYVFPVQPISSTDYGPYHHDYPATDIFCPIGSHFVAPTGGVVDYVTTVDRWDPATDDPAVRGGLSVAIIGDDGVRYYGSHLSKVEASIVPGVRVAVGQLLGLTGKTGDARFTDAHLHFGISPPTTPTDWAVRRGTISPYKYLQAWAVGTQLAPVLK